MPSAPVPPYWYCRKTIDTPALAGMGRLYSTLPATLFTARVNWRYPGVTPVGGSGRPAVTVGHALIWATPAAGGPVAPVRHALPCAVHEASSTAEPVKVSTATPVPVVGGSARATSSRSPNTSTPDSPINRTAPLLTTRAEREFEDRVSRPCCIARS